MKIHKTPEEIWKEFKKAEKYNLDIELYETVNRNIDFYSGNQWKGVIAPDLEQPVLNFIKRVVSYFISMIVSDDVSVSFGTFVKNSENDFISKILSAETEKIIEYTKAKTLNRKIIKNAVIDGDACIYLYFDTSAARKQNLGVKGEIKMEIVDNTNIMFGNRYLSDVQSQPYILIIKRQTVENARETAEKNNLDASDIQADLSNNYYGGDMGENDLVTSIIKMWKENGTVKVIETTEKTVLRGEFDTGYTLYPISYMSWECVKNSYHGVSPITSIIPNQIFVNKIWAMAMEHQKAMAFPKLFYDAAKIPDWTNKVAEGIAVQGNPNEAFASSFRGDDMSNQVVELVERTINYTKEFMGASDAALGNVRPDNTSAIIALQKSSSAPLELQRLDFYQFVEDYIRIITEIIRVNYGIRTVSFTGVGGEEQSGTFDFGSIDYNAVDLGIDIGSGAYFSEIMQMQSMDNLWTKGIIDDAVLYIEGVPDKYLKNKNKIIASLKEKSELAAMQAEAEQTVKGVEW